MIKHRPVRRISRREFLGATALTTAAGLAVSYGMDQRPRTAPYARASGFAVSTTAATPFTQILLITNPVVRPDFSPYLNEILRAEGFIGVRPTPLAQVDRAVLEGVRVVLIGAGPLSTNQATLLHNYVADGGALVGIKPDQMLGDLFGVRYLGSEAPGDYLRVSADAPETSGIASEPLQVHVPSSRLALAGARNIAASANGDPLVTVQRVGAGTAALWAFDLPHNIALIRQGNPQWADQERDTMPGIRASDLFLDWIDLDRIAVPQADEQQRLLTTLIEQFAASGPPLPRLWYFPGGAPAVVVATGDAHGSRVSHIERVLGAVERYGGSASIYYTPPEAGAAERITRRSRWALARLPGIGERLGGADPLPSPQQVSAWRARGHEFGMHPYVEDGLEAGYNTYWNEFIKYGYGPLPPTVRTHRILWHGWVENARVQARYGLRMNLDHYHSGPAVQRADGGWTYGYLSGSGLPMRFVSEDGALLSVYQQPTHLVDEHLMDVFSTGFEVGLTGAAAAAVTIAQIAESVQRYPAALGLQCHVDPFLLGGAKAERVGRWLDETLAYSAAQGLPVLSAERWLAFTEARATAQIIQQHWDAAQRNLVLEIEAPGTQTGAILLILPARHADAELRQISINGADRAQQAISLANRSYGAVPLQAGRQTIRAIYGA